MNEFWHWWQHLPSKMDPVLFAIGPLKIQYYGLMYIVAFAVTYFLVVYRIKREDRLDVSIEQVQNLSTAMIVGLIVGARLGYVLFYNLSYYAQHPLEIFLPFNFSNGITLTGIAGMSYHGGLIGVIVASYIYTRRAGLSFLEMADLYVPVIPMGYTFGRLGNFINGELYGRVTDSPIGMYFPLAPGPDLRHPSQLYEAFFEGIFLFIILWNLRRVIKVRGGMMGLYLIGYGSVRFIIEFFRQPDAHIGFVLGSLSMGQMLCIAMILSGAGLYFYLASRNDASWF
ncbi:prolipoprotein diacylglyceryl transferase [Thermodesulfobacteriota bacterium]